MLFTAFDDDRGDLWEADSTDFTSLEHLLFSFGAELHYEFICEG